MICARLPCNGETDEEISAVWIVRCPILQALPLPLLSVCVLEKESRDEGGGRGYTRQPAYIHFHIILY